MRNPEPLVTVQIISTKTNEVTKHHVNEEDVIKILEDKILENAEIIKAANDFLKYTVDDEAHLKLEEVITELEFLIKTLLCTAIKKDKRIFEYYRNCLKITTEKKMKQLVDSFERIVNR